MPLTQRGRESFSGKPLAILLTALPKTTPDPLTLDLITTYMRITIHPHHGCRKKSQNSWQVLSFFVA